MISSLFDKIHELSLFDKLHECFLPSQSSHLDETLNGLPKNASDLKIVEVLKKKGFELIKGEHSFSETITYKNKIYLMNEKTNHLYRPFSKVDLEEIKKSEVEGKDRLLEAKFTGFSFCLESELGFICAKMLICNFWELLFKTFFIGFEFCEDAYICLKDNEIQFAIPSIVFSFAGAMTEIARGILYSFGIQIAAFEGVFFDPIRGFFKMEQLERLASRGLDKKDDAFYQTTKHGCKSSKVKVIELNVLPWYSEIKLIHGSNLNDKIDSGEQLPVDKFELIEKRDLKLADEVQVFPFCQYAGEKLRLLAIYVQEVLIKKKLGGFCDYTSDKCRMAFSSGFTKSLPY